MYRKRLSIFALLICFLTSIFSNVTFIKAAENEIKPEVYDALRTKIKEYLVPSNYDVNDPDIKAKITAADDAADKIYEKMNKASDRTLIFTTYPTRMPNINIQNTYNDLLTLTKAYGTKGSKYYKSEALKTDIITALDWLYDNWYNDKIVLPTGVQTPDNNWFCYEIGASWPLADMTVLLYDELKPEQIQKYMATVELMTPDASLGGYTVKNSASDITGAAWGSTGANRAWKLMTILDRAAVVHDGDKLLKVGGWMSDLFALATSGDGFYADGSFIQHDIHAYTAGYGWSNLANGIDLLVLLTGTPWEYNNSNKANVFNWIFDAFAPLIYNGRIFDNVSGRELSRTNYAGYTSTIISSMINILPAASSEEQARMKSMIKYGIIADNYSYYTNKANIRQVIQGKAIVNDSNVNPYWINNLYKQYVNMDRVAVQRNNFAFGIAMNSNRIANYEAINNENLKGWNLSNGRTTILDADQNRYLEDYWATVDYNRLPGTTATNGYAPTLQSNGSMSDQSKTSNMAWVGGTDMNGLYGVTGMELAPAGQTLTARKSWFAFDDEIVALGAGINSKDNKVIETTIDNAKIKDDGSNKFIVDGKDVVTYLGSKATLDSPSWAYMQGNVDGSQVGYYFPEKESVRVMRDQRDGFWKDVNLSGSSDIVTRNYLTLWFNHGVNPVDQKYSYVLLPGKSVDATKKYASNPDTTIIENSKDAQAVRENKLNALAVNFWTDQVKTVDMITSDKKASVFVKETPGKELELSVSDPTWLNNNYINIELSRSAYSVISKDPSITVLQTSPSIKIRVNVAGAKGTSFKVKFNLDKTAVAKSDVTSYLFDVTPNKSNINGVVGFGKAANGVPTAADIAVGLRLNSQGSFDAKNGADYNAATQVPYQTGTKYTVQMDVNSKTRTYDAYVKQSAIVQKETLHDTLDTITKVFDKSSNWQKEGSKSQFKRNTNADGYLTYKVTNIENFTFTLQYNDVSTNNKPITDRAKFYISKDNKQWDAVTVNVSTPVDLGGISLNRSVLITPSQTIPVGYNYVKMVFVAAADPTIWSPQIDDAVIIGRTESLVDYKKIQIADDFAIGNNVKAEELTFQGAFSAAPSDLSVSNLIVYSDALGTSPSLYEPENGAKNIKDIINNDSSLGIYKTLLANGIDDARFILDNSIEGTDLGQYKSGTKADLSSKVTEVETVLNNASATDDQIIDAIKNLSTAVNEFMAGVNAEVKKAELQAVLDRTKAFVGIVTPADNQSELKKAIQTLNAVAAEAQIIFDASDSSQTDVNNASAKLNGALFAAYGLVDSYDILTAVELAAPDKINIGETAAVEVVAKDQGGNVIPASNLAVVLITSDNTVLNVVDVKLSAVKEGSTQVYAKVTSNGTTVESNKVSVTVEKKASDNAGSNGGNTGSTNTGSNGGNTGSTNTGSNSGNTGGTSGEGQGTAPVVQPANVEVKNNLADIVAKINDPAVNLISVDAKDNSIVSKEVFNSLKGKDKIISIAAKNVTWVFNGKDINNSLTADIDLSLKAVSSELQSREEAKVKEVLGKDVAIAPFSFSYDGWLPGTAKITLSLGTSFANKTVTICRYFADKNTYEVITDVTADSNGNITISLNHCSDYFAVEKTEGSSLPKTGSVIDASVLLVFGAFIALAGLLFIAFSKKRKSIQ